MRIDRRSPLRWVLRLIGLAIIAGTAFVARDLEIMGSGHAGHEPAFAYALALLAFFGGTIGVALLAYGRHLFDPVRVAKVRFVVSEADIRPPRRADLSPK